MTLPLHMFMQEHFVARQGLENVKIHIVSDNAKGARPPRVPRRRLPRDPRQPRFKSCSLPVGYLSGGSCNSSARDFGCDGQNNRDRSLRRPTRVRGALDVSDHTKKESRWESTLCNSNHTTCSSAGSGGSGSNSSESLPLDSSPVAIVRKLTRRSKSIPQTGNSGSSVSCTGAVIASTSKPMPSKIADPSALPPVKSLRRMSPICLDKDSASAATTVLVSDIAANDSSHVLGSPSSIHSDSRILQRPRLRMELPRSSCSSSSFSSFCSVSSSSTASSCSTFGSPVPIDTPDRRFVARKRPLRDSAGQRPPRVISKDRTAATLQHVEEALDLCEIKAPDLTAPPRPPLPRQSSSSRRIDMTGACIETNIVHSSHSY